MKFPDYRLSMEAALPSSVDSWLEQELEQRGIDSLIYTRYIISLLRQDIEHPNIIGEDIDIFCKYKTRTEFGKRSKKAEKKKFSVSDDELKKCAAIECLSAVSEEKAGIENLVEELCIRLKDSQIQESASPVSKLVNTNTDSSEESGGENQNPAQRYYAAFPSLHGPASSPIVPGVSPSVPVDGAWKHKPLVKTSNSETSEEDISSANEDAEIKKINKQPQVVVPRNKKVRKNNSRNNNNSSRNVREGSSDQHKNRSHSQGNRANNNGKKYCKDGRNPDEVADQIPNWPPGFAKKDPFILQNLTIYDEDDVLIMKKESPKRPDEELCTRVESLLKGMLLPTPEKTYKELQDVEDEVPVAKQENLTKPLNAQGNNDEVREPAVEQPADVDEDVIESPVSRDGSVSPELQENEFWYTQPIDVVFQSQDDDDPTISSKLRLYKRNSYPSFSPDSDCSKEPNADCLLSSASSPVFERNRSLSFASQCSDDIWNGSVLIPGWLTEEISADAATLPDQSDTLSISSFKASSPYPNAVEAESLFSLEASFHGERSFPDTSSQSGVGLTELDIFSTSTGRQQSWSGSEHSQASYPAADCGDWSESNATLFPPACSSVTEFLSDDATQEALTPDYCSYACWKSLLHHVDNNITPTPVSEAEMAGDEGKEHAAESVSLVDLEYLAHFHEDTDWNSLPIEETIKISSPKRFSLPNVWQGVTNYEEMLDYTKDLKIYETLCWQPLAYGENNFSQLWDVNMQKRNKFSSWSCPDIFSSGRWFSESSQYQKDMEGMDPLATASNGNKNTLIPTISIDVLTDSAMEAYQMDDFSEYDDNDTAKHLNRSISLVDVPSNWHAGSHKVPDPKLSKSFELVPSEHSAFYDVPKKLLQVHSEPNLTQLRHEFDNEPCRPDSPNVLEHLYFSPKTHFRPITPAYAPELSSSKAKNLVCHDLFGGLPTTKTPYMQYHTTDWESDEEGFCPKFKLKNNSKCIQTGDSLDKYEEAEAETGVSDAEEERDTPETLTLGMIENIMGDKDEYEPIISIADDLDTANTDSAYETDYGISALENDQECGAGKQYYQSECCHGSDPAAEQFYSHPHDEYGKPLGEITNYTVESFAATFPHTQDWPDMPDGYGYQRDVWSSGNSSTYQGQGWPQRPVDKHPPDNDESEQPQFEPVEVMPSWESGSSWCGDLITDHLYDETDAERYKDIWSTGQESFTIIDFSVPGHQAQFEPQDGLEQDGGHNKDTSQSNPCCSGDNEFLESDNCGYDMVFHFGDSPSEVGDAVDFSDGNSASFLPPCSAATEPLSLTDSGFQCVRLVYKDKQRTDGDGQAEEQSHYGDYNLMPMPNEALMSADLEKEWLTRDVHAIWMQHQPSSLQRKPCSFFLEGNCRRADCKFAHDISNITCRFWEEGCCFKGDLCPFLHGYPRLESSSTSPDSEPSPGPEEKKFLLNSEEFPELSLSVKNGNTSKGRRSKQLKSQSVATGSRKERSNRKGSNSRRHSNKENQAEVRIIERCSSSV